MGYNNVNPQADKKYVSALDPLLDTREIDHNVYDIWREDDFTDILNLADRKRPVKQLTAFYSWVNDQLFKPYNTVLLSGSGSTTITTASSAATAGFVRIGDIAIFADGNSGQAQSVTPSSGTDTVVWKSVSGTVITATAGDVIYVYTYAAGERSDAPVNKTFGYSKYSNRIQIFAESDSITDVQNASTLEAHVNGSDIYVVKSHLDKLRILKASINAAFIGGDISATAFSDQNPALIDQNIVAGGLQTGGGGKGVQTTRGLNKYVEAYGQLVVANGGSPNGTIALTDMVNLSDALNTARAPDDQLVIGSRKARIGVDNLFKNLGSSGVTSVRLNIDGRDLDLQVDRVNYAGFNWHFATMPILNHPMFSKTIIAKSFYFLPFNGRIPVEGGGEAACMGTRYSPANEPLGNEMIGESQSGTKAPLLPSGHIREFKSSWVSYQGFEFLTPTFSARIQVLP